MGTTAPPTHVQLKKRFKELQAATNNVYQNWQVRVHRSLSWMKRAEELPEELVDVQFVLYWIALNALYGKWDNYRNAPAADDDSRKRFVQKLIELDFHRIGQLLGEIKPLLKPVLGNHFLARGFWANPDGPRAAHEGRQDQFHLDGNLKQQSYERVLSQIFDRLYVLRCQIMHGAATSGSALNRKTLRECSCLLQQLVPAIITIVMERACNDDWPDLCYPPIK